MDFMFYFSQHTIKRQTAEPVPKISRFFTNDDRLIWFKILLLAIHCDDHCSAPYVFDLVTRQQESHLPRRRAAGGQHCEQPGTAAVAGRERFAAVDRHVEMSWRERHRQTVERRDAVSVDETSTRRLWRAKATYDYETVYTTRHPDSQHKTNLVYCYRTLFWFIDLSKL